MNSDNLVKEYQIVSWWFPMIILIGALVGFHVMAWWCKWHRKFWGGLEYFATILAAVGILSLAATVNRIPLGWQQELAKTRMEYSRKSAADFVRDFHNSYTNEAHYAGWLPEYTNNIIHFKMFGDWCGQIMLRVDSDDFKGLQEFVTTNPFSSRRSDNADDLIQQQDAIINLCSNYWYRGSQYEVLKDSENPHGIEAFALIISLVTVPIALAIAATKILAERQGWISEPKKKTRRS